MFAANIAGPQNLADVCRVSQVADHVVDQILRCELAMIESAFINSLLATLVPLHMLLQIFKALYAFSTNIARENKKIMDVFRVHVDVLFEFAGIRASRKLAAERAYCRMPSNVTHQYFPGFVQFSTLFAREFLDFVRLRVLLKCNCREENLLALFSEASKESWRLHLVIFDVKVAVI